MNLTDTLQRFHFRDSPVRGEICQLTEAYRAVLDRHEYPQPIQELLGQAMAAVALLASMLKLEGSLILQVQGDGPVSLMVAECNDQGEMRAIARYDSEGQVPVGDWLALVGGGQLILTIDPNEGQRYQGIVPLEGASLAAALGHYFLQSEQLPTEFFLFADGQSAGGLMLQVLPGHDRGEDADIWPRVVNLAATVKATEMLELPPEDVLYRLFHEEVVEMFATQDLVFKCSCSRERSENALRALDIEELRSIAAEHGGHIDVDCQFCRQRYRFDSVDIERLAHGAASGPEQLQ